MPPIVSELIKFTVARGFKLDSPNFARLRNSAVANGVKEQYFGSCKDTPNTLLWVIRVYLFLLLSKCSISHLYQKNGLRIKAP